MNNYNQQAYYKLTPTNAEGENLKCLYDRYGGAVLGLIRKKISQENIAEKILMEVFEKARHYLNVCNENNGNHFIGLANITRNEILHLKWESEMESKNTLKIADINFIQRNLTQVSPKYRAVLELFFVRGYGYTEIANLLNIDAEVIRKRVVEACKQLNSLSANVERE